MPVEAPLRPSIDESVVLLLLLSIAPVALREVLALEPCPACLINSVSEMRPSLSISSLSKLRLPWLPLFTPVISLDREVEESVLEEPVTLPEPEEEGVLRSVTEPDWEPVLPLALEEDDG